MHVKAACAQIVFRCVCVQSVQEWVLFISLLPLDGTWHPDCITFLVAEFTRINEQMGPRI